MEAPRTIRDAIQRQTRLPQAAAAAGFALIAFGTGAVLALHRSRSTHFPGIPVAMLVAGSVLFVVMLMALSVYGRRQRVNCPKCGADLGVFVYQMQDTSRTKRINFCPYCAVNLDDPMPQPPTPAENVTTPDKLVWK